MKKPFQLTKNPFLLCKHIKLPSSIMIKLKKIRKMLHLKRASTAWTVMHLKTKKTSRMPSVRWEPTRRTLWIKKMLTKSLLKMKMWRLKHCKRRKINSRLSILLLRIHIPTMWIELMQSRKNLLQIQMLLQSWRESNHHFQLNNNLILQKKNLIFLITFLPIKLHSARFLQWRHSLQIMSLKRKMTLKPQNKLIQIQLMLSISFNINLQRLKPKRKLIIVHTKVLSRLQRNQLEISKHNKELIKMVLALLRPNRVKIIPLSLNKVAKSEH